LYRLEIRDKLNKAGGVICWLLGLAI